MVYEYFPKGVCSIKMVLEVEDEIIKSVKIIGGCHGNLQGISALIKGMKVDEAIERLKGIECGNKGTSCPDQLAIALEEMKENNK